RAARTSGAHGPPAAGRCPASAPTDATRELVADGQSGANLAGPGGGVSEKREPIKLPGPDTNPLPPPRGRVAAKDAVKRFEEAWHQGPRPVIDDFLPTGDPLRGRVLIELVHIDLELRLKAGEPIRVEEYLARHPELASDRAVPVELIVAEHELR